MSDATDPTRRNLLKIASMSAAAAAALPALGQQKETPPLAPPDKQPPKLEIPKPAESFARWAVVGLGQLALGEVMPAFRGCKRSRVTALVSGHPDKAKQVAAAYHVDPKNIYNYENYDSIKENDQIDVVYNILPNHMHAEYTIRALKAGKHVLCEKPMAASSRECEAMIRAAKEADRKLMIAYRLRYEPYNQTMIEMTRKQAYGKVRFIEAVNNQNTFPPNIRLSKATAGGPLEDVGIYCINATRYVMGEEPVEVHAMAHQPPDEPRFAEVAASVAWTMRFPSGALAHCSCGFGGEESRRYRVHCENGWYELDPAFSYRGLRMAVQQGAKRTQVSLPEVNHFQAEMDHFSECVLENKQPWTPGEEGLADIRVIEKLHESARTGRVEKVLTRVAGG